MAATTTEHYDPLSHQKAAFNNHVRHSSPVGGRSTHTHAQSDDFVDNVWTERDGADSEKEDGLEDGVGVMEITASSPRINPFHLISHPSSSSSSALPPLPPHLQALADEEEESESSTHSVPPVHITRVTPETVHMATHPPSAEGVPKRLLKKVSGVFRKESNGDGPSPMPMQGPPPSPPISETNGSDDWALSDTAEDRRPTSPALFANGLVAEPSDLGRALPTLPVPTPRRVSNGSTSSRTGSLAIVRNGRLARTPEPDSACSSRDLPAELEGEVNEQRRSSATSLLQPPTSPRIHRRSTNPSPVNVGSRSPLTHSHSVLVASPRPQTPVPGVEGAALDSDILMQAETIRRERLERRQKKLSDGAEEKPEERPQKEETTKVLVGNLIGEDHVNYVLMYNMLTGIRIGVSRCQAKIKRPLTDEDYLSRHKFSFDIVGNELTPSARYDFKFKDYAPWVFRDLRDEHFHLDPADYLLSLTAKYILSELGSPGKSGSFFYFSRDYRFIIKTIAHSEHKFLRSILKDYHQHVKDNPHTLLSRFYGLHRVKLPRGRKIHFVIMNNLFPPHRDIHETYDLKGSAYGREYPEERAAINPKAVLKDKNWVNRARTLELGPEKRALFSEQLRRDMEFLKRIKVMDYSLLVGIHNMERGNRDNLRENQLSVFHPEVSVARRKPSTVKGPSEASNVRKAIRRSDPKMLDAASQLPTADSADRRHFLFYQDEGGLRATDEANQNMDVIYYLGIIDICTPYSGLKKIEHFWKSMTEDRHTISCVDPVSYGQRFINFLMSVMRGGDKSLRPPGLQVDPLDPPKEEPVGAVAVDGEV